MPLRLLVLALLVLSACAPGPAAKDRWPASKDKTVWKAGEFLIASGVGKPDPKAAGQTQRRSTSRDAAILDGRARLQDYLKRIMVADGVSVGERATEDEGWRKRLESATVGLEVAETKWDEEDTAAVILRVERAVVDRALGLDQ